MPISCPECAEPVQEAVSICASCGFDMESMLRVRGKAGFLPARLVGGLAYFVLPAAFFLTANPYKSNRFARFHSFQSLGWFVAAVAVAAFLWLVGGVLGVIPVLALLFLSMLVALAFLIIWIVLVVKALQGQMWKSPMMGNIAEKQADAER